jgi:PA14 domain
MRECTFVRSFSILTIAIAALSLCGKSSPAQTPSVPPNWRQLSPTDFAALIRQYFEQGTFTSLSALDQTNFATQGAAFFAQVDISNTPLSYETIETLGEVCGFALDQWTLANAKNAILARRDDWRGKPYAENLAKLTLMSRLNVPDQAWVNVARQWVLAGGTQAQMPQIDLVYDIARQQFADVKVIDGSFSVDWSGQVNVPQSGDYTFSISPIDVNMGFSRTPLKVSTSVFIAGQELITAAPLTPPNPLSASYTYEAGQPHKSNWKSQANAVTLTAGTSVNINVHLSVEASGALPPALLHAMLFWQGPGLSKSLVPASVFSQANGGAPGLQATYSWTDNGQLQSLSRTEPMIDVSWTSSPILLAQDPSIANQSVDAMWQAMTATSFLAKRSGMTLHPFLRDPSDASSGLSTTRRSAFLDLLLQNPKLLDAMDASHAVGFFESFRVGTPEKALDVFGAWAARRADLSSKISTQLFFDADTRVSLARMATLTTQQLPDQSTRLQQEFLQLEDGRCCLPVAYILTYSYLGRSQLKDWIGTLDAKLADPSLTGDLRVNWLLARGQAQEFTRRAILHYPFKIGYPFSWPLDGLPYLYQAFSVAQTPAVKARVAGEIVARFTSSGQYQAAKDLLIKLGTHLPDPQKALVAAWQQEVDGFVAAQGPAMQAQQTEATYAYLKTLRDRRARASDQGDSAAVSRYDALINQASNRP